MELVTVGNWRIRSDPALTRRALQGCFSSTRACGCTECVNFEAAREFAFPPEALALFRQLGIDPACESEVFYGAPVKPGFHKYGGWFHFVGSIEGKEDDTFAMVAGDFSLWFHTNLALVPEGFDDLPVIQLEFETVAPWVIDAPEPFQDERSGNDDESL